MTSNPVERRKKIPLGLDFGELIEGTVFARKTMDSA
jgi:hypothetical protein